MVIATVVAVIALGASPAFADPPRPTNYSSTIVGVTPSVDGMEVRIVGGDAFIELTAGGHDIVVAGYQGEPYLRFDAAGDVFENVRSPAHFLNRSRYSDTVLPPEADAAAEPEWHLVASGGTWVWHDHRTHWMLAAPPLGLGPGDQILDSVIPLVVDGVDVEIAVVSTWMPGPSHVPWSIAAVLGLLVGLLPVAVGRGRPRVAAVVTAIVAAAALGIGLWQNLSLPSATGPPVSAWALPASALVVAAVALVPRWSAFGVRSLTLIGAVQLVVWAVVRVDVLVNAILPTTAPFWLDRSVTAGVGTAALVLATLTAVAIGRSMRVPAGVPAT